MKKVLLVLTFVLAIVAIGVGVASQMPDTSSAIIAGIGTIAVLGMITDAQTQLSNAQVLAATAVSTNAYDQGSATRNIGAGEPLCIVISVVTAADHTTGDETYEFQIVQATANDLTTGQDILLQSQFTAAMAVAGLLAAGKRVVLPIPMGRLTKQFIGARYVLGGTTPSITVTASIMPLAGVQNESYPADSLTIL